jgi:hypothetical protein
MEKINRQIRRRNKGKQKMKMKKKKNLKISSPMMVFSPPHPAFSFDLIFAQTAKWTSTLSHYLFTL